MLYVPLDAVDNHPTASRGRSGCQSGGVSDDDTTFAGLALRPELLEAVAGLGYEEPTPIQREAIPPLLEGRDLLGQAATGTGKTAAFALPLLERLPFNGDDPKALVLVPTRELAVQVSEATHKYGRKLAGLLLILAGAPALAQSVNYSPATLSFLTRRALLGPTGRRGGQRGSPCLGHGHRQWHQLCID